MNGDIFDATRFLCEDDMRPHADPPMSAIVLGLAIWVAIGCLVKWALS